MSKIAQYLNEHILGEVYNADSIRKKFSRDGSILTILPEMVINPRVTNDIRKIARFTWQLAEKGHVLPMTVRGSGSDKNGGAIGKGIIINTIAHMNKVLFVNPKNKDQFVHTQPGVRFGALNQVLESNGTYIPVYPSSAEYSTIGGAVANNYSGQYSGVYGPIGAFISRMEIVLANGDIIESSRITSRDLDKKKGLQTFEGEIYRKIDGILEDNKDIIFDKIKYEKRDNIGYPGIAKVKRRDGSFDLSPLFIGSQGTLGIISEIVLRVEYYNDTESIIVATFDSAEIARDTADIMMNLQPSSLEIFDGELYKMALAYGKTYPFFNSDNKNIECVMFMSFNDFNERTQRNKEKQALKKLSKINASVFSTGSKYPNEELYAIRDVFATVMQPKLKEESMPPIIDGASVANNRREEFIDELNELAKKHHVTLPMHIRWLDGVINARPTLNLHSVSDKQKALKLISDYIDLVAKFDGNISADSSEGRLKATASRLQIDKDLLDVYDQIRKVFDPFGTLNPGVKQDSDLKTLISQLNPDYGMTDISMYSPTD
ncbi:MAG TPA: FAD-binding oxidoreductase [Candidatus Saccharibacteria bacterium]|nr:FAD-binding oxidoreductase [Candidatus Saccharibacteria bacterium]